MTVVSSAGNDSRIRKEVTPPEDRAVFETTGLLRVATMIDSHRVEVSKQRPRARTRRLPQHRAETIMSKLTATIRHEFFEMLPPTVFFFVILHIVALIRTLTTEGTGLSLQTSISVTIAALVLGKSVLLANLLPFINRFPEKPLIWNVGWKTAIYTLVALVVHYLEHLYDY